jgi:hypothetical protein
MYGKGSRQYLKRGHKKSPQTCEHYTMHIDNQAGLYCFALQIWGFILRKQKEKHKFFQYLSQTVFENAIILLYV